MGGGGRKGKNAGEKEQTIFPHIQVEASIGFSFPERRIITRQVGKLRLWEANRPEFCACFPSVASRGSCPEALWNVLSRNV